MPASRTAILLVMALLYAAPVSAEFWILSHTYSNGLQGPAHAAESRDPGGQVTEADAYAQAGEECATYPEVVKVTIRPGGDAGKEKVFSCEELVEMRGNRQAPGGVQQTIPADTPVHPH